MEKYVVYIDAIFVGLYMQAEVLPSLEDDLIANIPHKGEFQVDESIRVWIGVSRAEGLKCERCWNYSSQVGSFPEHSTLCSRCYNVVDIQQAPAEAVVIWAGRQTGRAIYSDNELVQFHSWVEQHKRIFCSFS